MRCKPLKLLKPFKKQKYTWNWTRYIDIWSSVTEDKKGTTKGPEVQQPSKPFGNTDKLVSNQISQSSLKKITSKCDSTRE